MRKYRRRPRLTEAEKVMMWNRWQQGDSLHAIARLLDTSHTSVRRHLVATGGIRPPPRRRSRLALSLAEREEISRGIVAGHSIREIATELGRAPSTISRELRRNGGRQHYRANQAVLPEGNGSLESPSKPLKRCSSAVERTSETNARL